MDGFAANIGCILIIAGMFMFNSYLRFNDSELLTGTHRDSAIQDTTLDIINPEENQEGSSQTILMHVLSVLVETFDFPNVLGVAVNSLITTDNYSDDLPRISSSDFITDGKDENSGGDIPVNYLSESNTVHMLANVVNVLGFSKAPPPNAHQEQPLSQPEASAPPLMLPTMIRKRSKHRMMRAIPDRNIWWNSNLEIIPGHGDLHLNRLDRELEYSVFEIYHGLNGCVIKYQQHCVREPNTLSSIENEIDILSRLNSGKAKGINGKPPITNKLVYYSDPVEIFMEGSAMYFTGIGKLDSLLVCPDNKPPIVQYMITERVGLPLCDYMYTFSPTGKVPLAVAAQVTAQYVQLLKRLHVNHNVIHTNINPVNMVMTADSKSWILSEWASAKVGGTITYTVRGGWNRMSQSRKQKSPTSTNLDIPCSWYFSPWETRHNLNKRESSYRDDMFRVIQIFAGMIHGQIYAETLNYICEYGRRHNIARYIEHFLSIKENGDLFNPQFHVPIDSTELVSVHSIETLLSASSTTETSHWLNDSMMRHISEVKLLLGDILHLVRAPLSRYDKPDYDRISSKLVALSVLGLP